MWGIVYFMYILIQAAFSIVLYYKQVQSINISILEYEEDEFPRTNYPVKTF